MTLHTAEGGGIRTHDAPKDVAVFKCAPYGSNPSQPVHSCGEVVEDDDPRVAGGDRQIVSFASNEKSLVAQHGTAEGPETS